MYTTVKKTQPIYPLVSRKFLVEVEQRRDQPNYFSWKASAVGLSRTGSSKEQAIFYLLEALAKSDHIDLNVILDE